MNTDNEENEEVQANKLEKIARSFWWFMVLSAGATVIIWTLVIADIAPKVAPLGSTVAAIFFLLLTIDFQSSATHTRSIMELQKRISTLEAKSK